MSMKRASSRRRRSDRPRIPILLIGLLLLWTSGWYGWGESLGLFWVTLVLTVVAAAIPWSLPSSLRSAIWTGLVAVLVCLAANVDRISPPEGGSATYWTVFDRVITIIYGAGIAALFFRAGRGALVAAACASLPMGALVVLRDPMGSDGAMDALVVWGGLLLVVMLYQAERWSAPRGTESHRRPGSEAFLRIALSLLTMVFAFALAPPLEKGALVVRQRAFGLMMGFDPPGSQNRIAGGDLTLRSPPLSWGSRTRPLAGIRAPHPPGYLREQVYTIYQKGKWLRPAGASVALERTGPLDDPWFLMPGTTPAVTSNTTRRVALWEYSIQRPRSLAGFCLPAAATALRSDLDDVPWIDSGGCVTPASDDLLPERYAVRVPSAGSAVAPPVLAPPEPGECLAVPPALAKNVLAWRAECEGLIAAPDTEAAVHAVVAYFNRHFSYRLGVLRGISASERLPAFMRTRKGHCTLFASAATMMLRAQGIPTRVVGGFYSSEMNVFDGTFVVRERDAHAWAEAWDPDAEKWVRVEATPASGMPDTRHAVSRGRQAMEWLVFRWRALVVTIRNANVLGWPAMAVAWLFLTLQEWAGTPVGQGVAVLLGIGLAWHFSRRFRKRERLDPGQRLRARLRRGMVRLERRVAPAHLRRHPSESWGAWFRHLQAGAALHDTPSGLAELVERYQALRYAPSIDPDGVRSWLHDARRWWVTVQRS